MLSPTLRLSWLIGALIALFAAGCASTHNHEFNHVVQCAWDYGTVDLCDKGHLSIIKHTIRSERPNFFGHYILLGIPYDNDQESIVVIDTRSGVVYTTPFELFGGYVDSKGFPDSKNGKKVKFNLRDNRVCFFGSTYRFQDVRPNQVSCFTFTGSAFLEAKVQ